MVEYRLLTNSRNRADGCCQDLITHVYQQETEQLAQHKAQNW